MPDIPERALLAAERAIAAAMADPECRIEKSAQGLARAALEAAAPVLAEHISGEILAHMNAREPKIQLHIDGAGHSDSRRAWRRHFRIAAQVAALAFSTPEDLERETAAAIERIAREDGKR